MKTRVALAKCKDYNPDQVDYAVNRAVNLLGRIEDLIEPRSKVLIKPNLLSDREPEKCITTHPLVVESIIRLVKRANAEIYVGDSSSVFGGKRDFDRVYEATGMREVCKRENVEMVYFDKAVLKDGIPITEWVERCDYVISVPKFKTHGLTKLTGGIKNLFGVVMGMHKAKLHKEYFNARDFNKKLVDIFELAKPTLTIVDAIVALEGDGPGSSGIKTNIGLILASQDAVAIDSILAKIMGIPPESIPTTKEARRRKLGESDTNNIDVVGEELGNFIKSDFKLPRTSFIHSLPDIPKPLLKIIQSLIWHKMEVVEKNCKACKRCIEICPGRAIQLKDEKALIDTQKCILCCCCLEVCPYNAITIKRSLLLKMLGV